MVQRVSSSSLRHVVMAYAVAFCVLVLMGCETVLGPSGSEPPFPEMPPGGEPLYDALVEGAPQASLIPSLGGFFMWKTGDLLTVRVARQRGHPLMIPRDVVTGSISIEGAVLDSLERQFLNPPDDIRLLPNEVSFRIELGDIIKGFSAVIRPVPGPYPKSCITLGVQFNGVANPRVIHLGRSAYVPPVQPVRICFFRP